MNEKLHELASKWLGPAPAAAVEIQIAQAEMRLAAFAQHQASRAAEGWQIKFVEAGCGPEDEVMIGPSAELKLVGRIDRIDYHPERGEWAIWDYKSSEQAKHPLQVHWLLPELMFWRMN